MKTTESFPHDIFYLRDTEIHFHTANSKNQLYLEYRTLQFYYKTNKQTNNIHLHLKYLGFESR